MYCTKDSRFQIVTPSKRAGFLPSHKIPSVTCKNLERGPACGIRCESKRSKFATVHAVENLATKTQRKIRLSSNTTQHARSSAMRNVPLFSWVVTIALLVWLPLCGAVTRISTISDCFEDDEAIRIRFSMDTATSNDWIAVVPPGTSLDPFGAQVTIDWTYTCGTKVCNSLGTTTSRGIIDLDSSLIADGSWKIILVTPVSGAWVGVAQSDPFEVKSVGGCSSSVAHPTSAPTNTPAKEPPVQSQPTIMPTFLPTISGTSSIFTDKQVYSANESIVVSFLNRNPQIGDWIGIYRSSTDKNGLFQGEMWMWICGGQGSCSDLVRHFLIN